MVAWALWDVGSTGLNAIVVTFVFSVYLTGTVGENLPSATTPQSWLFRALALSGLVVALLAPVTGVWVDAPWRRRRVLAVLTGLVVLLTSAMSLIRDDYHYLWPGLALLACAAACSELATVPYNAMLRQLSTPQTSGRVSGFGWGMGYFGSVVLLFIVYVGFIVRRRRHPRSVRPFGRRRSQCPGRHVDGRGVVRAVRPARVHRGAAPQAVARGPAAGVGQLLRRLPKALARGGRASGAETTTSSTTCSPARCFVTGWRGCLRSARSSASASYGISNADVLLFGVSASVIAAVGALLGGLVDDRLGSKPVIVGSLVSMIAAGLTLMTLSGPVAFWICGLLLCLFIGPTQSSARTLMLRMSVDGKEGVAFGLYTTTGRAVSFLAPTLISLFIDWFGAVRAGTGGLLVVLAIGLAAMVAVHAPHRVAVR